MTDKLNIDQQLLANIKANLPALNELLAKVNSHWQYEDGIYRYYHCSWKVYRLQEMTTEIVAVLIKLAPAGKEKLNADFMDIYHEGTGKEFVNADNRRWAYTTRPIVEAFLHARFFLEMAVKYGSELKEAPSSLPSGYAALLYLFNMR